MDHPTPDTPARKPLVLLVDDIMDNLRVVGNILREDNIEIAVASNGAEALAFVKDDPPDLILLDVMMPALDGYETCRQLKKDLLTSSIPVIFLTARADTDDVVRGFEAGGVDYVTKPFRPAELRARVRTHLQLHQLKGLLSICSYCNRIRGDQGQWERLDLYIRSHSNTEFSHGVCPECLKRQVAQFGLNPNDVSALLSRNR